MVKDKPSIYFRVEYGRGFDMSFDKGDCENIWERLKDGRYVNIPCKNKQTEGLWVDNSGGEYGPHFLCLKCVFNIIPFKFIKKFVEERG